MYREIIRPTNQRHIIEIPKEYLNEEVEILVLPFSSFNREKKRKKDLSKLLEISTWDIDEEDVKVKDWKIQTF